MPTSRRKTALRLTVGIMLAALLLALGPSAFVAFSTGPEIALSYDGAGLKAEETRTLADGDYQCILVLGCAVWDGGQPSPMLRDRLDTAIALYRAGAAPKLLLSGDNSVADYSEPDCMYRYALSQGVPEEDIFLDYAGFSTYDSVYRAQAVFCAERMIVVTQKYHLFRALYISRALGIDAAGAAAAQRRYAVGWYRELREVLARDKDLAKCLFRPEPTFLGELIPVTGDGSVTHLY